MLHMPDGYVFEFVLTDNDTNIKAIQQKIYKCKNCEHCEIKMKREVIGMVFESYYCRLLNAEVNADFFCSSSKRKT